MHIMPILRGIKNKRGKNRIFTVLERSQPLESSYSMFVRVFPFTNAISDFSSGFLALEVIFLLFLFCSSKHGFFVALRPVLGLAL